MPPESVYRFRPRVARLAGPTGELGLDRLLPVLAGHDRPLLLEQAAAGEQRFSVLGFDPLPAELPTELFGLRALVAGLVRSGGEHVPGPFAGGFLGSLAYDLGVAGETLRLPAEPWGQPLVAGGLYVDFLVRDERERTSWLVLGDDPGDGRPALAERRARLSAELERAARSGPGPWRPRGPLVRHVSAAEHAARIGRARETIARGVIYQANLAHRFTRLVAGDPAALYARLRGVNPAPYMGFLRFGDGALLSASPELLLEFEPRSGGGGRARTRPIKGTSARASDPAEDRRRAERLLASEKDLAELTMIVDLERNDLGRVAVPGGVRVDAFPRLESFAGVHHLMADVEADVQPDLDALDVLAALFPGGSVTGAPKLTSMELIAALEGEGRGFSFGALGFLDLAGRAGFNLLIRTLLWRARRDLGPDVGEAAYRVGGGITWGSDAEAEVEESLVKGARLAAALEGSP